MGPGQEVTVPFIAFSLQHWRSSSGGPEKLRSVYALPLIESVFCKLNCLRGNPFLFRVFRVFRGS